MSKDSHFSGQPVYSQVLKLLDKDEILQIGRKTPDSETYVKRFDGYTHLVVMLFGVLKHFASLRELEIGIKAEAHKLCGLMVKCTPERGHNALFFIPLQVFIML